jgi:hypothetical protein
MSFDEYLISKRIDGPAFFKSEPSLFETWRKEFDQMHPNSFTVQKLNLINPIRRKYPLKEAIVQSPSKKEEMGATTAPATKPGKPVIKPKPKIN